MSTPQEQVTAQIGAFNDADSKWWHRHLLYPSLLEDLFETQKRAAEYEEVLRLIASPMRADGTWNRDRAACQKLAKKVLGQSEESK